MSTDEPPAFGPLPANVVIAFRLLQIGGCALLGAALLTVTTISSSLVVMTFAGLFVLGFFYVEAWIANFQATAGGACRTFAAVTMGLGLLAALQFAGHTFVPRLFEPEWWPRSAAELIAAVLLLSGGGILWMQRSVEREVLIPQDPIPPELAGDAGLLLVLSWLLLFNGGTLLMAFAIVDSLAGHSRDQIVFILRNIVLGGIGIYLCRLRLPVLLFQLREPLLPSLLGLGSGLVLAIDAAEQWISGDRRHFLHMDEILAVALVLGGGIFLAGRKRFLALQETVRKAAASAPTVDTAIHERHDERVSP